MRKIETPENRLYEEVFYKYYLGVESDFLDNYLRIIEDISLEEVNQGIQEFILSNPLKVIVYGHPSIQSQLEQLKAFPPIESIPFKEYFKEELDLSLSLKSK